MWGKAGRYDKSYFRMVGIALLRALGVSITTQVIGGMLGGSESVVDRVSQIVFFPTFLGHVTTSGHVKRPRRPDFKTERQDVRGGP
jgi:hypothetical protein